MAVENLFFLGGIEDLTSIGDELLGYLTESNFFQNREIPGISITDVLYV